MRFGEAERKNDWQIVPGFDKKKADISSESVHATWESEPDTFSP
jgi:hypothetical protein